MYSLGRRNISTTLILQHFASEMAQSQGPEACISSLLLCHCWANQGGGKGGDPVGHRRKRQWQKSRDVPKSRKRPWWGQPQQCTNKRPWKSSTETQNSTGDELTIVGLTTLTADARNKWEATFGRAETALNQKRMPWSARSNHGHLHPHSLSYHCPLDRRRKGTFLNTLREGDPSNLSSLTEYAGEK